MSLKINPDPTFTTDLGISVPGVKDPVIVKITFKYKNRKEYLNYMEENKDVLVEDILADLVVGWKGFDMPYSIDNLKDVFANYPPTSMDMLSLYSKELFISKVKN